MRKADSSVWAPGFSSLTWRNPCLGEQGALQDSSGEGLLGVPSAGSPAMCLYFGCLCQVLPVNPGDSQSLSV